MMCDNNNRLTLPSVELAEDEAEDFDFRFDGMEKRV